MWKIIKAELAYLKFKLFPLLIILMGAITFYTLMDVVVLNRATLLFGIFISAQVIGLRNGENRIVKEMLIPISINHLALIRIIIIIIPTVSIYATAIILNLILFGYTSVWDDSIFELISLCFITILFSYLYYFFSDIFSMFQTRRGNFIYNVIITVVITAGAIFTIITIERSFSETLQNGITLLFIILISIICFALMTVYTLKQKESHIT